MYSSVLNETVKRKPGDFPSYWIKSRYDDRLGGIVYNDFDSSNSFQCTNIPAFATDDFAFDVVAFDIENRYTILNGVFSSCALNGFDDNLFCFLRGCELRLFHDILNVA